MAFNFTFRQLQMAVVYFSLACGALALVRSERLPIELHVILVFGACALLGAAIGTFFRRPDLGALLGTFGIPIATVILLAIIVFFGLR